MATDGSDSPSSASLSTPRLSTKRFWNWKLIGVEAVVIVLGASGFADLSNRFLRIVALGIAIVGLWLLIWEIWGLVISAQTIALPSGRSPAFPILARGRRRIKPDKVRELTVTNRWHSFEIVSIEGGFGTELLMFQSRGQRLRFMSAIEKMCPNVKMFRKMPLDGD